MAASFEGESNFPEKHFSTEFVVIDSNTCDYNIFFQKYMKLNSPCIIKNVGLEWESSQRWVVGNKPHFSYLLEKYGNSHVTIYDCNKRHYNSQETRTSLLQNYINNWNDMKEKLYYVKDWHLQNEFPEDKFYEVPVYFSSDWLNEFLCENKEDDYRFVYMGPVGTWTPFHADVFTSYSWSINICGQKKWILLPPGEENKLKDGLGNLPYNLERISLHDCNYFEIIQNTNEAIFVPSRWYHQVWNMKDTISINHNWINGCNINSVRQSLENHLVSVEKEIEDCQDMENFQEHCQVMLKASFGLDFSKFYQFLKYIALKRINFLERNLKIVSFGIHELEKNHAVFDLESIKSTLELFLNNSACQALNIGNDENLLGMIEKCIDNKD
ncbi:arginine demethylase and lysyl-hydroxylase jmjd [Holotrichia oblita]|uniref:Arginine demethylase and lysyl-hydroxylase jmjd n=1 Tax=Holotrichia oblita TaxID=644536 RepID=A0ACB9TDA5_HOLOL|nr:arginine demethylase and lysyl-hydroxylase jmjd [Holotrichia oblita]